MPAKKNGANGTNLCRRCNPHTAPAMLDMTSAIASPEIPSQIPPAANSFMSPIPMGSKSLLSILFLCRDRLSLDRVFAWIYRKTIFITMPEKYPSAAAITDSINPPVQGITSHKINPDSINGNRYTSGIIRARKSHAVIMAAQYNAGTDKIITSMFIYLRRMADYYGFLSIVDRCALSFFPFTSDSLL